MKYKPICRREDLNLPPLPPPHQPRAVAQPLLEKWFNCKLICCTLCPHSERLCDPLCFIHVKLHPHSAAPLHFLTRPRCPVTDDVEPRLRHARVSCLISASRSVCTKGSQTRLRWHPAAGVAPWRKSAKPPRTASFSSCPSLPTLFASYRPRRQVWLW